MIKKIAFVTGGGDCAGINAFIAAAARKGMEKYGVEFVGIRKAFSGATDDEIEKHLVPWTGRPSSGWRISPARSWSLRGSTPFPRRTGQEIPGKTRGEFAPDRC